MSEIKEAKKTIVAFHIGKGGRFYNAGFLRFKAIQPIGDAVYDYELFYDDTLMEFLDCSGNGVGLIQDDVDSGIGRIDMDGEYDTTYTTYLSDLSLNEWNALNRCNAIDKEQCIEILCDFHETNEEELETFFE